MRIKFLYRVIILFIFLISSTFSLAQSYRSLNFECGGYISGVFPVKYSGTLPPIDQQKVYVRSDIGGVYKSTNNGSDWKFISNFRSNMSPSELLIQGIALKQKKGSYATEDTIIVAWGNVASDALENGVYRSLWKSTNGGHSWTRPTIESPGVLFSGNCFKMKIGGECIIYHPDSSKILYMGGISPDPTLPPNLYKSTNGGDHWFKVQGVPFQITDSITCITMLSGKPEIWIGTTRGVYRSQNYGATWSFVNYSLPNSRRILLKKHPSGNSIIAFVTFGCESDLLHNGIARYKSVNNSWVNLTNKFDQGIIYGGNNGLKKTLMSALIFYNNDSNKVLAGRYGRPLRLTTGEGDSWTGNGDPVPQTGSQVVLRYDQNSQTFPNHQVPNEMLDFVYTGMNHIVQNPNTEFSTLWYSSGGAGLLKSENGGILYSGPGNHSSWEYSVNGINTPVVYDISFEPGLFSFIQIPISDWTNAYTTQFDSFNNSKLSYDRHGTRINLCSQQPDYEDTFIPNVTRALFSHYDSKMSYNIGGNVYDHTAKMYKRTQQGSVVQHREVCSLPWANTPDRVLVDGLSYKLSETEDRLVLLLGASKKKRRKNENGYEDIGVYRMDLERNLNSFSLTEGNFLGERGNDIGSKNAYLNSQISPLGTVSELFTSQFNLAKGKNGRTYLYLEGIIDDPQSGGFFISDDTAATWQKVSDVVNYEEYKDEGCLKYADYGDGNGKIFLAIKKRGLYYADDQGSDPIWNFTKVNGFTSAEQVDVKRMHASPSLRVIYVFGKRSGDKFNKIYRATINNGGIFSSWVETTGQIPSVRSLRINPDPQHEDELWIATSGQGVIIYKHPVESVSINGIEFASPEVYNLFQNYPNPFNPVTNIKFELPRASFVNLKIFDLAGKEITTLVNENLNAGSHQAQWNAGDYSSGIYFFRIEASEYVETRKMILIK